MKAFVGHSFDEKDNQVIDKTIKMLKSLEIECETGEKAQNKSIAEKVKDKISKNDIFVGIFTCDKKVKDAKWFSKSPKYYTTSNWVIQESGYALGKDKEIIFLVEHGTYKFPELQGDLELIYFHRDSLEKDISLKLNEMVSSIKSRKTKGISAGKFEIVENLEMEKTKKREEEVKTEIEDERQELFLKFLNTVFKEKDINKAKNIYYNELEKTLLDEEKPIWKARFFTYLYKIGDQDAHSELLKHIDVNKFNPKVVLELAFMYEDMKEYDKAKNEYLGVAKLYNIEKGNDKEDYVFCYKKASLCLARSGKYDEAINLLSNLLYNINLEKVKGKVLEGLAEIAKICEDFDKFFIYAEGALDNNPFNTDLRFSLAYQYSEKGHHKISLLHYKKLTDATTSSNGLNNLGVQYGTLELPAKSIKNYLVSAENKVTLALANLADRYLNEGFIKNAEEMIQRANNLAKEGIEVHLNVGEANNRLKKILENEDSKEKEILKEAEKEREFRIRYSESFYCFSYIVKEKFEGSWLTPWGEVDFSFDKITNSFRASKEITVEKSQLGSILEGKIIPEKGPPIIRKVSIKGNVEKMSGRYTINIREQTEKDYFPSNIYNASGYMIINNDYMSLDVMEKTENDDIRFHKWTKIIK